MADFDHTKRELADRLLDAGQMTGRTGVLRRLRRSREASVFGLLVFVTGVLVLPFLHNLHHRNDHVHGAGGGRFHGLAFGHNERHAREDDHDGSDHLHHDDPHPDEDDDHHAPDPEHGKGSLEHFGVAVTATHFLVLPTSFTLVAQAIVPPFESAYVDRYQLGPLEARAPPA